MLVKLASTKCFELNDSALDLIVSWLIAAKHIKIVPVFLEAEIYDSLLLPKRSSFPLSIEDIRKIVNNRANTQLIYNNFITWLRSLDTFMKQVTQVSRDKDTIQLKKFKRNEEALEQIASQRRNKSTRTRSRTEAEFSIRFHRSRSQQNPWKQNENERPADVNDC